MSEIWLKLVQQRTKNSKGVRTRGLRLDFNEIRISDDVSSLDAKVRTNSRLK